uniref:Uncharacterized protein n=1 Tax=Anguilla anguilla TaxID=7936 RepID=A0A0E9UEV9_ANGAN
MLLNIFLNLHILLHSFSSLQLFHNLTPLTVTHIFFTFVLTLFFSKILFPLNEYLLYPN